MTIPVYQKTCEVATLYIEKRGIYRVLTLTYPQNLAQIEKLYLETEQRRILLGTPWPKEGKMFFQRVISEKEFNKFEINQNCKAILLDIEESDNYLCKENKLYIDNLLWDTVLQTGCQVSVLPNGALLSWRWTPGTVFPVPSLFCLTYYRSGHLFLRWQAGVPVVTRENSW